MSTAPRDNQLRQIETQIRQAIRDAVNRTSRKPFYWGGLAGYQQLEAIAAALLRSTQQAEGIGYLLRLAQQVHRALEKNRRQAQDIQEAHTWLRWIAEVLQYPPNVRRKTGSLGLGSSSEKTILLGSPQVAQNMENLLQRFHPDTRFQPVQAKLAVALRKRWKLYSQELLHCYDLFGLPPDNLQMEALFGRLRRHQRRISGRKSTRELRNFGQAQVLFRAESEPDLLKQIQHVPLADYQAQQRRLMEAEAPCQFFHRLHQDPSKTLLRLVNQYQDRSMYLAQKGTLAIQPVFEHLHTE
jgi:hypothetical protein